MEEYIVSARKYRPMTFDSVVGQSALRAVIGTDNIKKLKRALGLYDK